MWVGLIQLVEKPKSTTEVSLKKKFHVGSAVLAPAQEFPAGRPALQISNFAQPDPTVS